MTRPTSDRSYFSDLKNNELNTSNAVSKFGGSPGLSTLYISTTASSGLKFLSTLNVSLIKEPTLIPSISSIGDLLKVEGINKSTAQKIFNFFN